MAFFIDKKDNVLLVKYDYDPERIAKIKRFEGFFYGIQKINYQG